MDEFFVKRLAFLRGYAHDDPKWAEILNDVWPTFERRLGVSNALDLLMLATLDGQDLDDRLNKAWYAALHESYEDIHYYDDYHYYDDSAAWEMSAADVWAEEDRREAAELEADDADVETEYRYFVRRYGNVWRAGHERRRLRQTG